MKLNIRAFLLAAGLSGAAVTGGVFIVDQEELVLGTYVDPVGIVTECAGQRADGQEPGQPRSMEYCLNQLADNLATYNRQLLRLTDGVTLTEAKMPLTSVLSTTSAPRRSAHPLCAKASGR